MHHWGVVFEPGDGAGRGERALERLRVHWGFVADGCVFHQK